MSKYRPDHHWFFERWCAEMVVEDLLSARETADRLGTSYFYVLRSVRAVYGCTVMEARYRSGRAPLQRKPPKPVRVAVHPLSLAEKVDTIAGMPINRLTLSCIDALTHEVNATAHCRGDEAISTEDAALLLKLEGYRRQCIQAMKP